MKDDLLGTVVFGAIAVVALAGAVQLIQTEVRLERQPKQTVAVASAPAPVMQPLPSEPTAATVSGPAQAETIVLPRVVVNGHRTPESELIAGTPNDLGAVPGVVAG